MAFKAIIRFLARVCVIVAALTLVLAADLKLQDPRAFRDALAAQGVLPPFSLTPAPWLIIALEAAAGLGALWGMMRGRWRIAARAAAVVFLCFAVYTAGLAVRPPATPTGCGCGLGTGIVEDWTPIAARNGAAAGGLLLASMMLPRRTLAADAPSVDSDPFTGPLPVV